MKRPPNQAPPRKPVVRSHVGPNWKFLAHLCIIAGLVYAISIAWQNLGESKAKREAENRQAAAKRAKDYEQALAESRRQAAARNIQESNAMPGISADNIPAPVETARVLNDAPEPVAAPVVESDPGPEFAALTARARELVIAAEGKRGEQFAENARALLWNLDVWLRSLPKNEQAAWQPHVAQIKAACSHGQVPTSIPESSRIKMSEKMAEFTVAAAAKQSRIDLAFLDETGKIHRAYLAKIQDGITQAESSGQAGIATALGRASQSAANLEMWLHSLGVDFQTPSESPARE